MSLPGISYLSPDEFFGHHRYGGILLHPTSLPSIFGIGDLGPAVYRFIDFLHENHQLLWQVLPLGPTGYGNSPYQSLSSFAGNPMLISPEKLHDLDLLSRDEIEPPRTFSETKVEFGKVIPWKGELLERAFENYRREKPVSLQKQFEMFCKLHHLWLEDYALFMSLKRAHGLKAWIEWDEPFRLRESSALSSWKAEHILEIDLQRFIQFIFALQWNDVRSYAHQENIRIIGDIPIFGAYDSADVWANPDLYYLDDQGGLLYVAGVPPDYFSETGQRWGNPLYRWDVLRDQGYEWWIQQLKHHFSRVDFLRIDHFRGFESFWRIPAEEKTAEIGDWIHGPGADLFLTVKKKLGTLPIIAENLGLITPEVEELLDQTGFPGMNVLQFAFSGDGVDQAENRFLPHNHSYNTLVYTGTHDNDTTAGWFASAPDSVRTHVLEYLNSNGEDIVGDLIRTAWSSVAKMAIIPLQDLFRLDTEGRMNFPGTDNGNWEWKFRWNQLTGEKGKELARLSKLYGRTGPETVK